MQESVPFAMSCVAGFSGCFEYSHGILQQLHGAINDCMVSSETSLVRLPNQVCCIVSDYGCCIAAAVYDGVSIVFNIVILCNHDHDHSQE